MNSDIPASTSIDAISLLAEGDKRTVHNVDQVVDAALRDTQVVDQLVSCLDEADEALSMRAADALQKVHERKPALLTGCTARLFQAFLDHDQKELRWHMAQILPRLPLTPDQFQQAAKIWTHDFYHSKSSIVKTFSLQAMHDVSLDHPSLTKEFEALLENALTNGAPAMKTRARKLHQAR